MTSTLSNLFQLCTYMIINYEPPPPPPPHISMISFDIRFPIAHLYVYYIYVVYTNAKLGFVKNSIVRIQQVSNLSYFTWAIIIPNHHSTDALRSSEAEWERVRKGMFCLHLNPTSVHNFLIFCDVYPYKCSPWDL